MIKRDLPETRCGWRYKNQILDKMHETDISIRRQAQVADVTLALQICCFPQDCEALFRFHAVMARGSRGSRGSRGLGRL